MSTAQVFNKLADVMGSALARAFPDTLTVKERTRTVSASGEVLQTGTTDAYTSVPCVAEPIQKFGWKKDQGDKIVASQMYTVTTPTKTTAGTYIALDPDKHYLVMNARGSNPAKTFRIISVGDSSGVVFEIVASIEG
jgi:hypothetical protein